MARVATRAAAWARVALAAGALSACTSSQDAGADTATDAPCSRRPARGVSIREIAAYQAGKVGLVLDGAAIAASRRPAPLVAGKDTLLRVHAAAEPASSGRMLSAQLTLADGDADAGPSQHLVDTKRVAIEAGDGELASSFNFVVEGARILPSTHFSVELFECEADKRANGPAVARWRFPAQATEPLLARELGTLKLRFVPIVINGRAPNTAASRLEGYARFVERLYPVSSVVHDLGEPLLADFAPAADGSGWQETLQQLSVRHQTDDAPNDVYYFGLLEPAETLAEYCPESCVSGIAYVTGAELYNRHSRVAISVSYGDRQAAESVAHELGHALGARHAPCGGGDDEDEAFPYPGGGIGWWGLELPETLHDPRDSTDIMGYCAPRWISDHTYRQFAERVAFVNANLAVLGGNPVARWRVVLTGPAGPRWGRSPRGSIEAAGQREIATVLDRAGNAIGRVDVYRSSMSLAGHASVMVPEPRRGWYAIVVGDAGPVVY